MATRIVLIRHASIDAGSRLHGSFDVPLSASGVVQVHARLMQVPTRPPPDALYTSPLRRAGYVATALGEAWALGARMADWAREIHCGDAEGMRFDDLQRRFPRFWARNQAQTDDEFAWPGGETYRQFRTRIVQGLSVVAAAHEGEQIAVVTHAGVISQVLGILRQRPPAVWSLDRPEPFTGTEVVWANGAPVAVISYNERNWY